MSRRRSPSPSLDLDFSTTSTIFDICATEFDFSSSSTLVGALGGVSGTGASANGNTELDFDLDNLIHLDPSPNHNPQENPPSSSAALDAILRADGGDVGLGFGM
ncbi:hypothetical protein BT69DRAFT_1351631, partial [Atractiella rhizophila]